MTDIIVTVFTVVYYAVTVWLCRKVRLHARDIAYGSLTIALTAILALFNVPLPGGSAFSLYMVPLMMLALLYDSRVAMVSGFAYGALAMMLLPGYAPVHWGQIFVEHLLCTSCMGYAGIFGNDSRKHMVMGIALASAIKLAGHTVSGALFFAAYAWDGYGPWAYSILFNAPPLISEAVVIAILAAVLPMKTMERCIKGKVAQ